MPMRLHEAETCTSPWCNHIPPKGCTHAPLTCAASRRSHDTLHHLSCQCLAIATEHLYSVASCMTHPLSMMYFGRRLSLTLGECHAGSCGFDPPGGVGEYGCG